MKECEEQVIETLDSIKSVEENNMEKVLLLQNQINDLKNRSQEMVKQS